MNNLLLTNKNNDLLNLIQSGFISQNCFQLNINFNSINKYCNNYIIDNINLSFIFDFSFRIRYNKGESII